MPEKITIEDLAGMVKRGFDGVDKRFDKVDKRFDKVDKRFDKVDARLEKLEQGQERIQLRLGEVAYSFEVRDLDRRLKLVEKKLEIV